MPPAGFEPAIPVGNLPQTHALDRSATGIGSCICYVVYLTTCLFCVGFWWTKWHWNRISSKFLQLFPVNVHSTVAVTSFIAVR